MAKKIQTAKKSFYEVVFQGKPKVARAYLSGLVAGSGHEATIFFSYLDGIYHEGKVERLSEMLKVRALDCHVIVDVQTNNLLKKLAKRIDRETSLAITSQRHIRSASMEVCFETFAQRYDNEIRALFKNLPAGLKFKNFKHDVKLDPDAKGIEAYAPAHHFEASGSGTLVGRVDLLIELKKKFADYPLIKSEEIILNLA